MSIEIKDLGIGKLKKQLAELARTRVTFGYQGPSGAEKHPDANATIAEVAAWQEYGTATSPARPLGRHTMETNRREFANAGKKAVSDLVDGRAHDPEQAAEFVGEMALRALRKTIDTSRAWAEANAESTTKAKGHDQPLIGGWAKLYENASWAIRKNGKIVKQGGEG